LELKRWKNANGRVNAGFINKSVIKMEFAVDVRRVGGWMEPRLVQPMEGRNMGATAWKGSSKGGIVASLDEADEGIKTGQVTNAAYLIGKGAFG
jgi:hypothetical protein